MERFQILDGIEDIGDVEGNFIIDLAQGISGFINGIEAKVSKIKASHLSYLDNLQNSNLIGDISKSDFTNELFNASKNSEVYKVPRSITFYGVNDFYIGHLNKILGNGPYLEESIKRIKRFRTKPKARVSVAGPNVETIAVQKILKGIEADKGKVFNPKDNSEYAKVGKYFGNVKKIHDNIDSMYELDSVMNDRYLHSMTEDVERLSKELKKLITAIDKNTTIISKDSMESVLLDVTVAADYVTAISNLYYLHIESITSLVALKNL